MENVVKGMREDNNQQQQNSVNQQRKIRIEKTEMELEAQLKAQEFKEMVKRLK